jgi:hypothetical protein
MTFLFLNLGFFVALLLLVRIPPIRRALDARLCDWIVRYFLKRGNCILNKADAVHFLNLEIVSQRGVLRIASARIHTRDAVARHLYQ